MARNDAYGTSEAPIAWPKYRTGERLRCSTRLKRRYKTRTVVSYRTVPHEYSKREAGTKIMRTVYSIQYSL